MKMHDLNLPESVDAYFFDTPGDTAVALADAVAKHLSERLLIAPRASLVVSGGSTPLPFFEALREKPLDWARIDVLLADERWVSEDDNDSNTRLVRESLLQGPASEARYLSLKQPGDTPADGLAAAGGYVPSERRVVLCQQWATKMPTEVSNTLAHELVRRASNRHCRASTEPCSE